MANYKSASQRAVEKPADLPGVGQYNLTDHLSLSSKQIQGGAPNNFTILSKSVNPYIHHVEVREQPRIPSIHEPSKLVKVNTIFQHLQTQDQDRTPKKSSILRRKIKLNGQYGATRSVLNLQNKPRTRVQRLDPTTISTDGTRGRLT